MATFVTGFLKSFIFAQESESESDMNTDDSVSTNESLSDMNTDDSVSTTSETQYNIDETINQLSYTLRKQRLKKEPSLNQNDCYEVEKLLDMRKNNTTTQYLVKWADSEDGETFENTWENEEDISTDLIRDYHFNNQIDEHNSRLTPTNNVAHLYLRVSDKAKTAGVMSRSSSYLELGQTQQTPQSYFTNFPEGNFSLDSQKEILFKYCLEHKYKVKSIKYDDGVSARDVSKLNGLQTLISEIATGETLMFIDLTRFSRDSIGGIKILDDLHARGVRIYSVLDGMNYDTPVSRHCVRSAISGAQLESDLKSLKIRTSIQNIKNKGGFVGSKAPFGQKIAQDGHLRKLVVNQNEKNIITRIGNMVSNQNLKPSEIAKQLNDDGLTYRGKLFTQNNVKYIMSKYVPRNYSNYSKSKRNVVFMNNRWN